MKDYELVVIVSPEVGDEDVTKVTGKISGFITGKGGNITDVKPWGRKKMAYPIGKYLEGNYILTTFKIEPKMTKELEASLRLTGEVLRHLLVRMPEAKGA